MTPELDLSEVPNAGERRRLEGFLRLSRIERGLRGFLHATLPEVEGPKWWNALPPDIRDSTAERDLAYTNFADLKKVVQSKWAKLSSHLPTLNKQQVLVHLEELEAIRNDIAHSRDVSIPALALVQATYFLLEPTIQDHMHEHTDSDGDPSAGPLLLEIRGLVERKRAVPPLTVARLSAAQDAPESIVTRVEEYDRLASRPGRSRESLREVATQTISEIDAIFGIER